MPDKRPLLVSIICLYLTISATLSIGGILLALIVPAFAAAVTNIPLWSLIFNIIVALLYLVGLIYIWGMKRWALIFLTVVIVIEQAIRSLTFGPQLLGLIISVVLTGLLWIYHKQMN